jgi:hypothetical protein
MNTLAWLTQQCITSPHCVKLLLVCDLMYEDGCPVQWLVIKLQNAVFMYHTIYTLCTWSAYNSTSQADHQTAWNTDSWLPVAAAPLQQVCCGSMAFLRCCLLF